MSYKITDGEYVLDENGRLVTVEGVDELLQRVLLAIKAERHRFYPDKNFGSYLSRINREPFCEYAAAYIRQALDDMDGVFVKKVIKNDNNLQIKLLVNNSEKEVILQLEENI